MVKHQYEAKGDCGGVAAWRVYLTKQKRDICTQRQIVLKREQSRYSYKNQGGNRTRE